MISKNFSPSKKYERREIERNKFVKKTEWKLKTVQECEARMINKRYTYSSVYDRIIKELIDRSQPASVIHAIVYRICK